MINLTSFPVIQSDIPVIYKFKDLITIGKQGENYQVYIRENRFELKMRYLEIGISLCISMILLEERMVSFHAAGLIKGKLGYMFVGKSESGKTTLSKIADRQGLKVINDELITVQELKICQKYLLRPGPQWGNSYFESDFRLDPDDPWIRGVPLGGIFFLGKKSRTFSRIQKIQNKLALAELMASFLAARFTIPLPPKFKVRVLDIAGFIIKSVPVSKINISLKDNFLNYI